MEAVDLHYFSVQEIADAAGLSVRRIQRGIKRAREMALDFQTIWAIEWRTTPNVFNRENQCEWHNWEEIPQGLEIGCLACVKCGLDYLIREPTKHERATGQPEPRRQKPQAAFAERMHGKT
jgi:hypothetical protein